MSLWWWWWNGHESFADEPRDPMARPSVMSPILLIWAECVTAPSD